MRRIAVVVLFLCLSGCAGAATPRSADTPSQSNVVAPGSSAAAPATEEDKGSISGSVVDDEARPVAGVAVNLNPTDQTTKTDERGNFTFNGLAAGRFSLVFERGGYEDGVRRVDVEAGKITPVKVTLKPIVIPDAPYYSIVTRVAYLHATWVLLTSYLWQNGVNNTQLNGVMCDPCRFTIHFDNGSADALSETLWRSGTSISQPTLLGPGGLNAAIWLQYVGGVTDANPKGAWTDNAYVTDRQSRHLSEASTKQIHDVDHMQVWVSGNLMGVNVEHKVEIDTTFGYGAKLDQNFTALPPK